MSGNIKISVDGLQKLGSKAVVNVKLPNGYEHREEFEKARDAVSFARGIKAGLMLALNAIGFVGEPVIGNIEVEEIV